jgi:O-methyltransferase
MLETLRWRIETARLSDLAREVRRRNLTYLVPEKLRAIETSLSHVENSEVVGDFLEFGVALGGSAVLIASHLSPGRVFHGYDVFGMIPAPSKEDDARSHQRYEEIRSGRSSGLGGETYYGYMTDLYDRVCETFRSFGMPVDGKRISLHRGLFADTLNPAERRPVAFAHIDCDWHDPVRFCLESIGHRIPMGGRIVLDDYNDYGGCRKAADAFLQRHPDFAVVRRAPSAVLERIVTG